MVFLHGTTLRRAELILLHGPDPCFLEPGGQALDDGFSLSVESGPFHFGTPEDYARGKSQEFPDEGGPVILVLDVPEEIVLMAANEWFPISQGLIQFDLGSGLEELIAAWPSVAESAVVRSVS